MYGWRLRLLFETGVAFALGVVLTFITKAGSWSENAVKVIEISADEHYHSLLNGLLLAASWAFKTLAHEFPKGKDILYDVFGMEIRIKHMLFNISYGFGAILIFQLDSNITSDIWHYVATGYTVICLTSLVTGLYKMWSFWWHVFTWTVLGAGLWLFASFKWSVSLVRYPEWSLMVIGLALVLIMAFNNNFKNN